MSERERERETETETETESDRQTDMCIDGYERQSLIQYIFSFTDMSTITYFSLTFDKRPNKVLRFIDKELHKSTFFYSFFH